MKTVNHTHLVLKTLDELQSQLKDNIQKSIDDDYEKRKREEFISYFVSKIKFKAPESMVNRYLEKSSGGVKEFFDKNS